MSFNHKQQHWQAVIEKQSQSGLTHAKFCQQNDIKLATFYYWTKKLHAKTLPQQVHPLIIEDELITQQVIITSLSGLRVAFPADLPKAQIHHWLKTFA